MIEIKQLSKHYGKQHVLDAISLRLTEGKTYGVVGENGAGKTTLFRCICGLESHKGTVAFSDGMTKNNLGFLQTEPFFFNKLTGKEYIHLLASAKGLRNLDFDKINIFKLPLNKYASTYSSGMKKKLALTAVLAQKNDVLILDEPFNGVDIQSNLMIVELLKQLKKANKSVLISSHIFSTLVEVCDTILLLKNGQHIRSVERDDFSELEQELKDFIIGDNLKHLDL